YTVNINGIEIEFHDALLAPPSGVMSTNYSRVIHREDQPHKWSISWTTERTREDDIGGAFYVAQYGIRISGAKNTLIAWQPNHFHGTSLQLFSPDDDNPECCQRGLAIVTPKRLPYVWSKYKEKEITRQEAMRTIYRDEEIEY
ncbi:hypothetical protein F5887DRAFT_888138, partial [Amanita rubescens]